MRAAAMWSEATQQRPFARYAGLLFVVPAALGAIGGSVPFGLFSGLVTAGVTVTLYVLYMHVVPRLVAPRTPLQIGLTHIAVVGLGTAVGALPAVVLYWSGSDSTFSAVFVGVMRIAWVVSTIVVGVLVALDRASAPHAGGGADPRRVTSVREAPDDVVRLKARHQSTLHVFDPRDVTRLYATDKYVALRIDDREYLLDESLTALEARLGRLGFVRTHRGELVNRRHVRAFEGSTVLLSDGQRARVSRRSAARVRRALEATG